MPQASIPIASEDLRETVRAKYAAQARRVTESSGSCCEPSCCGDTATADPITGDLYAKDEVAGVPEDAVKASLGCGNPTALAELKPGETVLDLGSGGGIDVLLSGKRVSPGGKAYGLDMTDEMLALAEENKAEAGAENVEFLKGHIEEIPLPENHVDVVISNCVINLSTDKPKVISEAFRVLKSGGRFAVSDMVFLGDKGKLPEEVVQSIESWAGCVSGALEKEEYETLLSEAGFEEISVEVTHTYDREAATGSGCCGGTTTGSADTGEVPLASAFIRGRKPGVRGTP